MTRLGLCDTHSHIHDLGFPWSVPDMLKEAAAVGVDKIITLGSNQVSCQKAIACARRCSGLNGVSLRACLGFYPHETASFGNNTLSWLQDTLDQTRDQTRPMICGIGEIGLDYHSDTVSRHRQTVALEEQIQLALDNQLPISFHVRSGDYGDAFSDFWSIIDNFTSPVKGVLHSFTDNQVNLDRGLSRGLYIGVNGIVTFNRDEALTEVYQLVPLERLVLETDSPYLAPKPFRSQVNQPAYIRQIAEYLAKFRGVSLQSLAQITSNNAMAVYKF